MTQSLSTPPRLLLARCTRCGGHSFPAHAWGCRVCGSPPEQLDAVPCAMPVPLRNVITVHGDLVPGVAPPCVIGEVELAPGLIEEALLDVGDEAQLYLGMGVTAVAELDETGAVKRWRFRPAEGVGGTEGRA